MLYISSINTNKYQFQVTLHFCFEMLNDNVYSFTWLPWYLSFAILCWHCNPLAKSSKLSPISKMTGSFIQSVMLTYPLGFLPFLDNLKYKGNCNIEWICWCTNKNYGHLDQMPLCCSKNHALKCCRRTTKSRTRKKGRKINSQQLN